MSRKQKTLVPLMIVLVGSVATYAVRAYRKYRTNTRLV